MRTSRRRRPLKRRRHHRRTSRNPIPPSPGYYGNRRHWEHWLGRTFSAGTTVRTKHSLTGYVSEPGVDFITTIDIPVGSKGKVTYFTPHAPPGAAWCRIDFYPTWQLPPGTFVALEVQYVEDMIEPLDDNWGPAPRPMTRAFLPASQRSWLKPNIDVRSLGVPPPGTGAPGLVLSDWIERTFAPGTPVALNLDTRRALGDAMRMFGAASVRAVVTRTPTYSPGRTAVIFQIVDARDVAGIRISKLMGQTGMSHDPVAELEPMVDNWASASRPLSRHQLPRAQRSYWKP